MKFKSLLIRYLKDFFNLIYPECCLGCGTNLLSHEKHICMRCKLNLPKTQYHKDEDNPLAKLFWGRIELNHCAAYLHYNKGMYVQNYIHDIKYKGNINLGILMGEWYGNELKYYEAFNADYIIPVPLHPKKEKLRGYNQSEVIARGLSKSMGIPVLLNVLIRKIHSESQTKKNQIQRWENVKDVFDINSTIKINNKHIILLDDVITTGSTIESCVMALLKAENIKITVLSLGVPLH